MPRVTFTDRPSSVVSYFVHLKVFYPPLNKTLLVLFLPLNSKFHLFPTSPNLGLSCLTGDAKYVGLDKVFFPTLSRVLIDLQGTI